MWRVLILQCIMLILGYTMAITSPPAATPKNNEPEGTPKPTDEFRWNARSVGRILARCFAGLEVWQCLGVEAERVLDAAVRDNSTWQVSEFLSLEPQPQEPEYGVERRAYSGGSSLGGKLLELAQSRALRVRVPRETISNAIDDIGTQLSNDQGRKKKDKDKNMAMMGGMIMLATFAQMFLGKVILIAGSAFIMAKIALVISLLGSLKKGMAGPSSGTDHVIVTSSGSSSPHPHSHESGWHRSISSDDQINANEVPDELNLPMGSSSAYHAYAAETQKYLQMPATLKLPTTAAASERVAAFL